MGARIDASVLNSLVNSKLPHISKVFTAASFDTRIVTFSWLLSFFGDIIPLPIGFTIIDWLLLDGMKALFRTALVVFKMREQEILNAKNVSDIILALSKKITNFSELNRHMIDTTIGSIPVNMIPTFRQMAYHEISGTSQNNSSQRNNSSNQNTNNNNLNSARPSVSTSSPHLIMGVTPTNPLQ